METDTNEPVAGLAIAVTRCTKSDFEGVFPLLQQLWPAKPLNPDRLRSLFTEALPADSRVLLCARCEGKVVGFGSMTLKAHLWHGGLIGWIDELVVDDKARGKRVGRKLLEHLMKIAGEKGCCAIELDSAFHREEAHSFYEALGFQKRAYLFFKELPVREQHAGQTGS